MLIIMVGGGPNSTKKVYMDPLAPIPVQLKKRTSRRMRKVTQCTPNPESLKLKLGEAPKLGFRV